MGLEGFSGESGNLKDIFARPIFKCCKVVYGLQSCCNILLQLVEIKVLFIADGYYLLPKLYPCIEIFNSHVMHFEKILQLMVSVPKHETLIDVGCECPLISQQAKGMNRMVKPFIGLSHSSLPK